MLKQLLTDRINYWLSKRKRCRNQLTKYSIDLVLNEILLFTKELYNSHLIAITTYLEVENKIRYKDKK